MATTITLRATSCSTSKLHLVRSSSEDEQQIILSMNLTRDRVTQLFAWVSRAFAGEEAYGNLMLAFIAIFGNLPDDSQPNELLRRAMNLLQEKASSNEADVTEEDILLGAPYPLWEREQNSLGAMGYAQITGQWKTRPHALLDIRNMTSYNDWFQTLPRGCKRTLKKACNGTETSTNFTVQTLPIYGDRPAPHSSLAHFRCVVEHEVRVISATSPDPNDFFAALQEAVGRYMGTTRMAGTIHEYRHCETGEVLAFAHEVTKARTIRGQWFYANDEASKNYVWFHSVQDLVRRAIEEMDYVDVVDLGPSGTDGFSQLKEKYGFVSVDEWTTVADYVSGPFHHEEDVLLQDFESRKDAAAAAA